MPATGREGGGDEELQRAPEPAGGEQVEEAALVVRGGGVGERGEVPDQVVAGAEELEGERGVAVLVEVVVVEDVGGAEDDCVARGGSFLGRLSGCLGDAEQGGQATAGVAGVGFEVGAAVADAAGVGAARAAGGGQVAVGGQRRVDAERGVGGDAWGEPFDGGAARGDEDGTAAGALGRGAQLRLLAFGQEVGDGDQQGGVRGRPRACVVQVSTTRVDTPRSARSSATARLP